MHKQNYTHQTNKQTNNFEGDPPGFSKNYVTDTLKFNLTFFWCKGFFLFICVCFVYMYVYAEAKRESQMFVSCHMGAGIDPRSFGRSGSTLVCTCVDTHGGQKTVSDPMELELQVVMMWC